MVGRNLDKEKRRILSNLNKVMKDIEMLEKDIETADRYLTEMNKAGSEKGGE